MNELNTLQRELKLNKIIQESIKHIAAMITTLQMNKEHSGKSTKKLDALLDTVFEALALPSNNLSETMKQMSGIHEEMKRIGITADQLIKAAAQ